MTQRDANAIARALLLQRSDAWQELTTRTLYVRTCHNIADAIALRIGPAFDRLEWLKLTGAT